MSAHFIAKNCAPTLAGLKAGSLFPVYGEENELLGAVSELDRHLNKKGVHARLLWRKSCGYGLVYIYRTSGLNRLLEKNEITDFLNNYGYIKGSIPEYLDHLEQRLDSSEFPHEIGVFLDYPLDDIKAFIKNRGCNCPCTGCWKAYTNVPEAKKTFRKFNECTDSYCRRMLADEDLIRLTKAG